MSVQMGYKRGGSSTEKFSIIFAFQSRLSTHETGKYLIRIIRTRSGFLFDPLHRLFITRMCTRVLLHVFPRGKRALKWVERTISTRISGRPIWPFRVTWRTMKYYSHCFAYFHLILKVFLITIWYNNETCYLTIQFTN